MPTVVAIDASALLIATVCGALLWFAPCAASADVVGEPQRGAIIAFPTEEVFEQWRMLEKSLFDKSHVRATLKQFAFKAEEGPDHPTGPPGTQLWKMDRNGDSFLVQIAGKAGIFRQVLGRNPKYAFGVQRVQDRENWRLVDFQNAEHVGNAVTDASRFVLHFLQSPYRVWDFPVQTLFESKVLNTTATRVGVGSQEVVTVEFEHAGNQNSEEHLDCVAGGVIRFDPARHWAIRDYELRTATKPSKRAPITRVSQRCTYRKQVSAELATVQYEFETATPDRLVNRWDVTVDDVSPSDLKASGYTLPAFGVAEPPIPGAKSPFTSRWFWALQIGLCVLLIGLLLRRRAKR